MATTGITVKEVPAGMTEGLVLATMITMYVVAFLLMIPQICVGLKGLKVAKEPDSSKGHIVWAIILLVFAAMGLVSSVSGLIQTGDVMGNIFKIVDGVLDVIAFLMFTVAAVNLSKAA